MGNFSSWWEMSKFLASGGDSPITPSTENPDIDCNVTDIIIKKVINL